MTGSGRRGDRNGHTGIVADSPIENPADSPLASTIDSPIEDPATIDRLVTAAAQGDVEAIERLLVAVRDRVYRLSLRMVTRPSDAEDATQEILLKALTRLSTYRGDAAFTTWLHRIAVNHLLDRRKSAVEREELTFDLYGDDLRTGLAARPYDGPDAELLAEEVRLACTQAMLTCLDRDHRVTYVLGEIFEVSSDEGATICDVPAATYRKRLSRARARVRSFLDEHCGLVQPDAPCRCSRRVETAVGLGRIDPEAPALASHPTTAPVPDPETESESGSDRARRGVAAMERLSDAAALFRHHPDYAAPAAVTEGILRVIEADGDALFG